MRKFNFADERLYGAAHCHNSYPIDIPKTEVEAAFKIPEDYFNPTFKDPNKGCAFIKLGIFVVQEYKKLHPNGRELNLADVFVSEKTYQELSRLSYYWMVYKHVSYLRESTKRKQESNFGWLCLQYSPMTSVNSYVKDNYVYIRKER